MRALRPALRIKNSHRNEARAARPRWSARSCVLSRANSAAIHAPCVLVSHSTIAPGQRVVIPKRALAGAALAVFGRGEVGEVALDARCELVRLVVTDDAKARFPPGTLPATTGIDAEPLVQPRPLGARDQCDSDREQGDVQPAHVASLAERSGPRTTPTRAPRPSREGRRGTGPRPAALRRPAGAAPPARRHAPSGERAPAATRGASRTRRARTPRPGRLARLSPAPRAARRSRSQARTWGSSRSWSPTSGRPAARPRGRSPARRPGTRGASRRTPPAGRPGSRLPRAAPARARSAERCGAST